MTFDLPLIRDPNWTKNLTPLEKRMLALDSMITALMMQGSMNDPRSSEEEVQTFMTLSVAAIQEPPPAHDSSLKPKSLRSIAAELA